MKYVFLIIILIIIVYVFLYYQNNHIDITNYDYNIVNNTSNNELKIVHLSDFHSNYKINILNKLIEINPDIIFITGDYINDKFKNSNKMVNLGKDISNIAPVYYIYGNHENRLENQDLLNSNLAEAKFNILDNKIEKTKINNLNVNILGLNEKQGDFKDYRNRKNGNFVYSDNSKLFEEFEKFDGIKIVLSHYPENFEKIKELNYSKYNFDIQLSGHAHGGQFILPFIGPIFSPGQGLFPKYARGTFGNHPKLYVSRGIGNSEFPFRLFNHPEIIVINIKNNKQSL